MQERLVSPRLWPPLRIMMLSLAVFLPSLWNEFVDWDDYDVLLRNPNFRGLGWAQLSWMFTTFHMGPYHPLTWMSFALDYLLWELNPVGYHLTNILLHAANAVLVYFLALELTSRTWSTPANHAPVRIGAEVAALFFAIHPLRVESVTWVTERKDVLSGFFLLLSVLVYVRTRQDGAARRLQGLLLSLVSYALSLLSKAVGVTLGIVLLIMDIYPLRRLPANPGLWRQAPNRRILWEKVPFIALGLGAGLAALAGQSEAGATASFTKYPLLFRFSQSAYGLAFYLWKTLAPFDLSPLYEVPLRFNPLAWPFLVSALVVATLSTALLLLRNHWPAGLTAWSAYMVMVFPFLGVFQSGPQIAADRYTYLPCLPWALLAGSTVLLFWAGDKRNIFKPAGLAAAPLFLAAIAGLGVLTWNQQKIWHDTNALWTYVVARNPNSWLGHYNFGTSLEAQGRPAAAIEHYESSLRVHPYYVSAHYNLANLLAKRDRLKEAIQHYEEVLRLQPSHASARANLGNALLLQGETQEAIRQYRLVLEHQPEDGNVHFNLGNALSLQGRPADAIPVYRRAVQLQPGNVKAYHNLASALLDLNQYEEAIHWLRQGLAHAPHDSRLAGALESAEKAAIKQTGKRTKQAKSK